MKVIRCLGLASGTPCDCTGQYVRAFDADAYDGRGHALWTADPDRALRFADAGAAWQFWMTQSRVRPLRDDGKPNRPLTAYHIETMDAPA